MPVMKFGKSIEVREVKAADDAWTVTGYASTFDNTDEGGDVVVRGAFARSVHAWGTGQKRIRFLYQHDPADVLGVPTSLREDHYGLLGQFKISRTTRGHDAYQLLKDGALDSFSIGYVVEDQEYRGNVRVLRDVDLMEISVVSLPMNTRAAVTGVKRRVPPTRASDLQRLRVRMAREGKLVPRTEAERLALWMGIMRERVRLAGVHV